MLEILPNPILASQWCEGHRSKGRSVGFVPTMGALHAGHMSLIKRAIDENDITCVSIFVNPLQFNDPTDYGRYPRDLESDYEQLRAAGCNMVFGGSSQDFFPEAARIEDVNMLDPGPFARGLEGDFRPGHLEGVCTVVDRLFRFSGPCRAYFGMKDYQQLLVIEDLARKLGYPEIVPGATVRDGIGLALSSRNSLLTTQGRSMAGHIYQALTTAKRAWQSGEHGYDYLRGLISRNLKLSGLEIEYVELRNPDDLGLESPTRILTKAIALIAVRVESVRLIDNLRLD